MFREEPQKIEQNRAALMARLAADGAARTARSIDRRRRARQRRAAARRPDGPSPPGRHSWRPEIPAGKSPVQLLLGAPGSGPVDTRYRDAVVLTLRAIAEGGIYDHLGGGFSRYSTDARWLVPHFEKMLYDNAQLVELLTWVASLDSLATALSRRAHRGDGGTWLKREMPPGGRCLCRQPRRRFRGSRGYASTSGLSAEISRRSRRRGGLPSSAEAYDVTPAGNFEGHNILNRLNAAAAQRRRRGAARGAARETSRRRATARVRPGLDDKVLADWNGLMIAALANASLVVRRAGRGSTRAARAFAFIARAMTRGDRLGHSWRDGKLHVSRPRLRFRRDDPRSPRALRVDGRGQLTSSKP